MKNLYTAFFAAKITVQLFMYKNSYISSSPAENRQIDKKYQN